MTVTPRADIIEDPRTGAATIFDPEDEDAWVRATDERAVITLRDAR